MSKIECPCGGEGCEGVNDGGRHQCGGPAEACCVPGCQECGAHEKSALDDEARSIAERARAGERATVSPEMLAAVNAELAKNALAPDNDASDLLTADETKWLTGENDACPLCWLFSNKDAPRAAGNDEYCKQHAPEAVVGGLLAAREPVAVKPLREVVGAVIIRDGRVLLTQRRPGKSFAYCHESPGGKVDPGESHHEALGREGREELGIEIVRIPEHPLWCGEVASPNGGARVSLYLVTEWTGEPTPREGQGLGWYEPCEIPGLVMTPANVAAMGEVVRAVKASAAASVGPKVRQ